MHKTVAQTRALLDALRATSISAEVEVVVCPPYTALAAAHEALHGCPIALGAQTMHEEEQGAFTGEISPLMLGELGVTHVILGHSERRRLFGETDAAVARKVRAALAHDITPIVAVGETLEEHQHGMACERSIAQTRAALEGLAQDDAARCVIAYEPIWAIGTGLVDEPTSANAVMGAIRDCLPGLRDVRILYGGSMKPENAASLMAQPHIDGGLIGGASLTAQAFTAIIQAAQPSAATA